MDKQPPIRVVSIDALVWLIDAIFSHLNVGMLVYNLPENSVEANALKLVYVNEAASTMTGSDLSGKVGQQILEAFPALEETGLPEIYREVAEGNQARELGVVTYEDADLQKNHYAVRAFPVPNRCVGVVFEAVGVRKRVEALVMKQTQALRKRQVEMEEHLEGLRDFLPKLQAATKPDAAGSALPEAGILGELTSRLQALLRTDEGQEP